MENESIHSYSPWFDRVPDEKRYSPLASNISTEVVVVGGGIAGIMSAYHLAQAGRKVVLVEKNHVATGDTGLTTGFLTHVPDASIATLVQQYGPEFVQQLFAATRAVQQELFSIIERYQIDCEFERCSSYWGAYEANHPVLKKERDALQQAHIAAEYITRQPDDQSHLFAEALQFKADGRFHVRRFILGLLTQLQSQGAQIYEETEVTDFTVADRVTVTTTGGTIQAQQIILATGAPLGVCAELQPLLTPYITHVVAARFNKPLALTHAVMWDVLDPYFYYRTISTDTLIVGSCDHLAETQLTPPATEQLRQFITEKFGTDFTLTHQWAGSIFHTTDGLPYAFAHPHYNNKVFVAMGFGGNGLIGGSWSGKAVAELALGKTVSHHTLLALKRTGVTITQPAARVSVSTAQQKKFVPVAKVGQLKPNSKICITGANRKVALFFVDGQYYAMDNPCSHAGGSLADGVLTGNTVECPLHGAKFNVTTGAVEGAPAVRAQRTYPVRVVGEAIEVELPVGGAAAITPARPRKRYWKQLGLFSLCAVVIWMIEFAYQYYIVIPDQRDFALIRTAAITGVTFFSSALCLSAVFKWWPRLAGYWRLRRYFGVAGFLSIACHVLFVTGLLYQWEVSLIYYSFNPLQNPIIFGSLAFPVFFLMAATSTDWAVEKLGTKRWKNVHRLVYFGYGLAITHFLIINPLAWQNVAGYIMLGLTAGALLGQLYWYLRLASRRRFRSLGTILGLCILGLYGYLAYIIVQQLSAFFR